MKTFGLRPRELYPSGIVRCYEDEEGLNRPIELVEGAKKESNDICVNCRLFHNNCPKPDISENIFVELCKEYEKG